jgi:hypothetical protein
MKATGHSNRETEIKLPVHDASTARRMLRAAGFRVSRRRVFEANTVFDTPEKALRVSGSRAADPAGRQPGDSYLQGKGRPPHATRAVRNWKWR